MGKVTYRKKYWAIGTPVAGQQFAYGFDDIGNRVTTQAGGDQCGANLSYANYTVNTRNQYTSRTVPQNRIFTDCGTPAHGGVGLRGAMSALAMRGVTYESAGLTRDLSPQSKPRRRMHLEP